MIEAIYQAILKVHTYQDAAALCNISYHCLREWIKHAEQEELNGVASENSLFIRLSNAVKRARAEVKAEMLDVIRNTAKEKKEWLPAAWYTERTDPDNFGRRDRHDFNISEQKVINITRVTIVAPRLPESPGDGEQASQQEVIEGEVVRELEEGNDENQS